MYVYIDFESAKKDGRIDEKCLSEHGYFIFKLDDGRNINGQKGDEGCSISCKILPKEAEPYFIKFSELVRWQAQAHRHTGVYTLGTARGTLDLQRKNMGSYGSREGVTVFSEYVLLVDATQIEDCVELIRRVRAGSIMPVENWEAAQEAPRTKKSFWTFLREQLLP